MKDTVYLIADKFGVTRMTKRQPGLGRAEIGVRVTITIPDGCFTSPLVACSITVPEDRVIHPTVQADVDVPPEPQA
jgi:hypothetical protein